MRKQRWFWKTSVTTVCVALIGFIVYAWLFPMNLTNPAADPAIDDNLRQVITERYRTLNVTGFEMDGIVHKEWTNEGVVVFYTRKYGQTDDEYADLNLEYWKKTLLGWKWVTGGGYQFSNLNNLKRDGSLVFEYVTGTEPDGSGEPPLPIVYGESFNQEIVNIELTDKQTHYKQVAKMIPIQDGRMIWFVRFPFYMGTQIEIQGLNEAGKTVVVNSMDIPIIQQSSN
ncbi:hypothetical protein [Paenibacillus arenilitoris]|uniref:Uncharacterized protein n=1 Tax=Paenibacillus arenilitoris TaxID=2772299 RepID=A0A927H7U4_9BACL|nr:hypothetical protein [Paenibacillus arenilitoris]MBD2871385.1 hypothetical protein [Paenibacillus arenilitoris]